MRNFEIIARHGLVIFDLFVLFSPCSGPLGPLESDQASSGSVGHSNSVQFAQCHLPQHEAGKSANVLEDPSKFKSVIFSIIIGFHHEAETKKKNEKTNKETN